MTDWRLSLIRGLDRFECRLYAFPVFGLGLIAGILIGVSVTTWLSYGLQ